MSRLYHRRTTGLTLIELMIGITISLFMLIVISYLYINGKQMFRLQNSLARMQENGRTALSALSREVHAAGFAGCSTPAAVNPIALSSLEPIKGYTDVSAAKVDLGGAAFAGAPFAESSITGPILVIHRGADNSIAPSVAMASASSDIDIGADTFGWRSMATSPSLMIVDCTDGNIFTPNAVTATKINVPHSSPLSRAYGTDARIMLHETSAFFVATPTGRSFSSLYQRYDNGSGSQYFRLADNVERMDLAFGQGDPAIDAAVAGYAAISGIANWQRVKSVRVHLLLRSATQVLDKSAPYYYQFATITPTDRFMRKEFASVIAVRTRISSVH